MKTALNNLLAASFIAGALLILTRPAFAQDGAPIATDKTRVIEVITVTARKKVENIQDTPLAVSALSGEQLQDAGIDSFDQVLDIIPNAGQAGGIAGTIQGLISIRGISTLVRFVGLETGVGYYIDGVYAGRPENFNQDLIDIERIEILRGPQGALFGKNTIAGAVNIITRNPSDTTQGILEAQYGNYDHTRLRTHLSGPLSDSLSASLSAGYTERDGFVKHLSGGEDLDNADLATFRGKLRFQPGTGIDLVLAADGLIDRSEPVLFEVSDLAFFSDPSQASHHTTNHDQPNFVHRDLWGIALTGDFETGAGTLTSILSYRDSSFDASLDDDKHGVRVFVDIFGQDSEVFSAELRHAGRFTARSDYIAGLYYYNQESKGYGDFALGDFLSGMPGVEPPITLTSAVESESVALFFNTNHALTDRLQLEIGGRWVSETKNGEHVQNDQTGLFGTTDYSRSRTDEDFAPTVSIAYDFNSFATGYLRFAQGFKSAGFNVDFVGPNAVLEVAPEFATSYEAGLKSSLFKQRVRLDLSAFHTRYKDLQLTQIVGGGVSLANAAAADIFGVEAEATALVGEYFDLRASLGYLDATYDDFPGCQAPGATAPERIVANCAGRHLNLAPEWTASLDIQFRYPIDRIGELVLQGSWNHRGRVYFEPQNDPRLSGKGRDLVSARVGLDSRKWQLFLWGQNLTDAVYVNFADDRSPIGVRTTQAYGRPRTYGATLGLKF